MKRVLRTWFGVVAVSCCLALCATIAALAAGMVGQSMDAPPPSPSAEPDERPACPPDMALVSGSYCRSVEQRCLRWLDASTLPFARCAEYARPARCLGPSIPLRFCIDRYEYTRPAESLVAGSESVSSAAATCASSGRRLCNESEWTFACEGEEMRPYPYGFKRQPLCNQDHHDLFVPGKRWAVLRDLREPATARPGCISPWGVLNLVGNVDEPVRRDTFVKGSRFSGALKGGWWMPGANRCRATTYGHDDFYRGIQVGVRCCASASQL